MNKFKWLSITFFTISIMILCFMCIFVTYKYCDITYAIKYDGASAPATLALLYIIPFAFSLLITSLLTLVFYKKYKNK